MKEKIKEWIFSVIGLTAGAALAAAALENFLIPFRILDGGLNGIGMIINFLTDIPLSILIVILNIPFFIIGFIQLGRDFIIKYLTLGAVRREGVVYPDRAWGYGRLNLLKTFNELVTGRT